MKKIFLLLALVMGTFCLWAQTKKVVAPDGSGDFKTVQAAIDAVPDSNTAWVTIYIKNGIYKENITISTKKSFIKLVGENNKKTILTFDNYASKKDSKGREFGTTGSSSVFVDGDNISFENLTFENSSGPVGQAVAVNVRGNKVAFHKCRFLGFQDTLYTKGSTLQYYKECYIEGTVDFIFGAATALFERCTLNSISRGGPVTAASTDSGKRFGYVFLHCKLKGDAPEGSSILGRPWRPFAKTVFIKCEMGKHINPIGWDNWGKPGNEKTAYYAEYKSSGKGANPRKRLPWSHQLTEEEAREYTAGNILGDWKPF